MKHSTDSFENEITEQILISELCFDVCHSIPGFPGLGDNFLPYFYNLNYQKGLNSLHSLLLSFESNELSFKNYFKLYKEKKLSKNIGALELVVNDIAKDFKSIAAFSPRNKIGSHLDGDFTHVDFTCGYLMPEILDSMITITRRLKESFFPFVNHSPSDDPYRRLMVQIHQVVDKFTIEEGQKIINHGKVPPCREG